MSTVVAKNLAVQNSAGTASANISFDGNKLVSTALESSVKTALNASGNAPIYACRAWVNFNGTGTVAIRASGNVSSITDNNPGQYTVNLTTAMMDNYYSWSGGTTRGDSGSVVDSVVEMSRTSSSLSVHTGVGTATTNYIQSDVTQCNIQFFR